MGEWSQFPRLDIAFAIHYNTQHRYSRHKRSTRCLGIRFLRMLRDFEYDKLAGWLVTSGSGTASGTRSWDSSSESKATWQVPALGLMIYGFDPGLHFDWVNSVETTYPFHERRIQ